MKIKRNYIRYALKLLGIAALTIACFMWGHELATAERGYQAVGGELVFFLLPYFLWIAPKLKDSKLN